MCDLAQEEFWVLLLNQATKLIDKIRISSGGIDGTYADVRSILREALMQRATQIAVVHNHPSGNIQPSQPDRTLTEHIRKAADTMNIRLIDHVIVCEDGFYSLLQMKGCSETIDEYFHQQFSLSVCFLVRYAFRV